MSILNIDTLKRHGWLHFYQMDSVGTSEFIPPILCRGQGVNVYDAHERKYIDAISGAYCVNVGYGRERILKASYEAAKKIHFVSPFSAANPPMVQLSEKLCELAKPVLGENARVYFVNSGAEAVDTAIKIARAYSRRSGKPDGHKIICRDYAYHGTTLGAMSCCGFEELKKEFEPLLPGITHVPNTLCTRCPLGLSQPQCAVACANEIENRIQMEHRESVAAVLIEPLETSSGIVPPPAGYLNKISDICRKNEVLLILDEVITGFGRLFNWFGAQRYSVKADMLICAKGLTSGYDSLAAVIVRNEVANVFSGDDSNVFKHGSTFGGRPGATSAALENIKIIEEENLFELAQNAAAYLEQGLSNAIKPLPLVGEIRHDGLIFGIDLVDKNNDLLQGDLLYRIRHDLTQNGLITSLFYTRNEPVIELAPPLIITNDEIDQIIEILSTTLNKYK